MPKMQRAPSPHSAIDGRDAHPAGSAAEWPRGSIDGRDLHPAGSAAEWQRGSIDGRDLHPAGSAAEWQRGSIDELRTMEFAAGEPTHVHRIPDGSVSLLLRTGPDGGGHLVVLGPLTRARYKRAGSVRFTVRAILSPIAARRILGVPLDLLTDRITPVDQLWGATGRELTARLVDAKPSLASRHLGAAIVARHAAPSITDLRITRALALLREGQPVTTIARELELNERTFRRAFTERVGLSPKRFARIARLQRVLRHARPRADWARLALELGYFDQSHLVNDFRDLMGTTPAAYDPARPRVVAAPGTRRAP